jgi:di/tricarboxylate transporter
MDWQAWVTLATVITTLTFLVKSQRAPDLILWSGTGVLLLTGIITPKETIAGFANEGLVTVAAMYVVAAGMERTGAMSWLIERVLGRPRTLLGAQAAVMLPPALLSAFMNNTPLVAMMMPVVSDWSRKHRFSVSKLLLPMNYAVVLGGLGTLIGTSSTIVVSGLLAAKARAEASPGVLVDPVHVNGLGMFDITWTGVPAAVVGLVVLLLVARRMLPERRPAISSHDDLRQYTVEMMVDPMGPLVGRTIEEAGLRHLPGMFVAEIDRDGHAIPAVAPTQVLDANDRLVFVGIIDSVKDLQKIRGLMPATEQVFKLDAPRSERRLIEAVVSNTCPLIGKTVREGRFRSQYNAVVIAVARNGERINKKIGDIVLRPGDTLLLEAHPSIIDQQRNSRDFFLIGEVEDSQMPLHHKAPLAAALLVSLVVAASVGWVSIVTAAITVGVLMVLTRCCTSAEARRSIDLQVLMVIAASFGLAKAMENTGVAADIASRIITLGGANPLIALAMVHLVTMCFAEVMSHNAAAVLVFPIAWGMADKLGVNHMPFVIAVALGASCGLATPFVYQTNLMVFGPGGYRVSDYLRLGGLLNILVLIVDVIVGPMVFPFHK